MMKLKQFPGLKSKLDKITEELKPLPDKSNEELPACFLLPQERIAPSEVLRSALFGIGSRKKRQQVTEHPIFTCGGTQITYTGQELDQGDLDVFMAAIRMAYDNGKAFKFTSSVYAFQKLLNLPMCGSSAERIKASFKRMTTATVTIKNNEYRYYGHLIDSFKLSKKDNTYKLRLNPEMSQLFQDGYTRINWESRRKLRGDLGRRLQALVLSHEAPSNRPQRYTTETLRRLCRSEESDERKFNARVRKYMRIFETDGQIKTWTLRKNTLHYTRT